MLNQLLLLAECFLAPSHLLFLFLHLLLENHLSFLFAVNVRFSRARMDVCHVTVFGQLGS